MRKRPTPPIADGPPNSQAPVPTETRLPVPPPLADLDDFSAADLQAALKRRSASREPLLRRLTAGFAARVNSLLRSAGPLDHPERAAPMERVLSSMPSWLASVIVHTIFLLLVGLVAVQVHRDETSEMAVELAESPEDFEDQTWAETLGKQLENPTPGMNDPELAADLDSSYSMSDLPAVDDPLAAPKPSLNASAEGWDVFSDVEAPSIGMALTGRQKGRKEALLLAYGGTKSTQDAVNLALAWLARKQENGGLWSLRGPYPNGSGTENKLAATAMALLAFLGDGHTHLEQDQFRQTVHKGVKALLKIQGDEGEFFVDGVPMHHRLYTHAQCTIALCELYGITKDSMLREPAQKAVDYCVKIQAPEGGWRYFPYEDSDTSVTGWFVMALQSARMAELTVPTPCLKKAGKFLDAVASHGGSRYAYQAGRVESHVMTAEALLCRQYLGWPRDDRRLQQGVAHISRTPVDFDAQNVYYWYYATQVMHHMGGQRWVEWNRVMRQAIPENQEHEGKERGSWDPSDDEWGRTTGRLYMTCLSTYMLEVYYRHLPLYSMEVEGKTPPSPPEAEASDTAQVD